MYGSIILDSIKKGGNGDVPSFFGNLFNSRFLVQFYDMQLVTPRDAAMAVKIDSTIWNTVFQVSFFIRSFFSD